MADVPSFAFEGTSTGTTPPLRETTFTLHDCDDDDSPFDGNTLSPLSARFPPFNSMNNTLDSPSRQSSHLSPSFASSDADSSTHQQQPFGFTPQQYVVGRPAGAAAGQRQTELGRRRGHKYARSSVSHQIILSPTPRLPLQLPSSLPIPTFKEFRASMTSAQRTRWALCLAQLGVAGYVQWTAHGSMASTALSHLLFYDALSSVLSTAVGVGRNFEVWTRSSLVHPFGLERSELVAGLAMSIVLLFMGLDCISHGLTHSLEGVGGHEAHHAHHEHEHAGGGSGVNLPALVAILSTLIAATSMGAEGRVGRSVHSSSSASPLKNPPQLLILLLATILAVPSLLGITMSSALDMTFAFLAAGAMITTGARLCYTIGRVLLMSYPSSSSGGEVQGIVAELWEDAAVLEVQEAKVWQVHYGLCMANLRVSVRRREDVERVRGKIGELVRSRLANAGHQGAVGGGKSAVRWEVSSMISVADRD